MLLECVVNFSVVCVQCLLGNVQCLVSSSQCLTGNVQCIVDKVQCFGCQCLLCNVEFI